MATQEERWARAERALDVQAARRVRRTPGVVIGILALLVLAVGATAAVDLKRLQTPRGAALAWVEAATFGDCRGFLALSVPRDPTAQARTEDALCRTLRSATADARSDATRIRLTARSVRQRGGTAAVDIDVRGPAGSRRVRLDLVHRGHAWLVLRDAVACGATACY
ncbi:MAG: hypothetical protein NVSMB55_02890 [Mycobacteriales bacterium]